MKTKLLIIAIVMGSFCSAQITLEHTFSVSVNWFLTSSGIKFWSIQQNDYPTTPKIVFYNSDYSVYKNVTLDEVTGIINNNLFLASDKLFNSDDLIEFILVYQTKTTGTQDLMSLYNESGTKLMDFGFGLEGTAGENFTIFSNENKTKLLIYFNYNGRDSIIIYSLPGQMPTAISQTKMKTLNKLSAYPNPTTNTINLLYNLQPGETTQMRIYNSNGVLIDSKIIDSNFDMIQLNVENYSSGIYFYEVNGKTSKFIVNK